MALEKYKICPACGVHNPPSLLPPEAMKSMS